MTQKAVGHPWTFISITRADLLAGAPATRPSDPVDWLEQLLRGFKPLLQMGTRPLAQLQDLLQALAITPAERTKCVWGMAGVSRGE